jgi:hypothetical protein
MGANALNKTLALLLSFALIWPIARAASDDPDNVSKIFNNLSYPAIFPEGVRPAGWMQVGVWRLAPILMDDAGRPMGCVGEDDIVPPEKVAASILCYYGRKNLGLNEETGESMFTGDEKIWWLQRRQPANAWQVFNITDAEAENLPEAITPVIVTGVDTRDFLESRIAIRPMPVRVEFTLLKNVEGDERLRIPADPDYTRYLMSEGCTLNNNSTSAPNNCFGALSMSGAVPGTDQSSNEIQGVEWPRRQTLCDPATLKQATDYLDRSHVTAVEESDESGDPRIVAIDPPLGMHATVYSACARLVIQPINRRTADSLTWNSDASEKGGYWVGDGAKAPVVNIAAWETGDHAYSAEINADGSLLYRFNWNATSLQPEGTASTYRLTLVLEGGADQGGQCPYPLNTVFDETTLSVNVGSKNSAVVLSAASLGGQHGEGGAAYLDITVGTGKQNSNDSGIDDAVSEEGRETSDRVLVGIAHASPRASPQVKTPRSPRVLAVKARKPVNVETPVMAANVEKPAIDPADAPFYLQSSDQAWPNLHPLEPQSQEYDSDSQTPSRPASFTQIPANQQQSDLPKAGYAPDQASTIARDFPVATIDPLKTPPAPEGRIIPPPGPLLEIRYKPQHAASRRSRAARGL